MTWDVILLEQGSAPAFIETLGTQEDAEKFAAVCNRIAGDALCEYVVEESEAVSPQP